ncbi:alpha/beta hydrolase [Aliidiomarina celeris]|uniref:alpha/beta hydrolase n=1 Tax=Aliidiomarina celeris TaxID=2249428 RepID=UPI000DEADAA8|nr:alpha/beta hydrolase [Aliidiomarina celeris]
MQFRYLLFFVFILGFLQPAFSQTVNFQAVLERSAINADQVLRYGNAEPQFIELFLPKKHTEMPPLVVYIHGGCWLNSFGVDHARGLADGLRKEGVAVAAIEYRRLDDQGGGWPNTLLDIEQAITQLTAMPNAPFRTTDITLIGHSAGGHLALLASQPKREHGASIRGVIGLAAITDIRQYAAGESGCQQAAARFIATAPEQEHVMNPVHQPRHSNITLLWGTADPIVGRDQQELAQASHVIIENAGHFDVIHPGTPAFRHVVQALRALYPQHSFAREEIL